LICGIVTCAAWLFVAFLNVGYDEAVWKRFDDRVRATERLKNPGLWLVFILIAALLMLGRLMAWSVGAGEIKLSISLFIALVVLATFVFSIAAKDNAK